MDREVFKYLGRLLAMGDSDSQAVHACLKKTCRVWARLSNVLQRENASPRTCGKFFQAIVQAVLLYGIESWDLRGALVKQLRGFQTRAAYKMCKEHRPRVDDAGVWTYPDTEASLRECGLRDILEYIEARRATVVRFVVDRSIFKA